jgi:hypothetical protein
MTVIGLTTVRKKRIRAKMTTDFSAAYLNGYPLTVVKEFDLRGFFRYNLSTFFLKKGL